MKRNMLNQSWLWASGTALLVLIALLFAQRFQKPAYETKLRELGYPPTLDETINAYYEGTSPEAAAAYEAAFKILPAMYNSSFSKPRPLTRDARDDSYNSEQQSLSEALDELLPDEDLSPELADEIQMFQLQWKSFFASAYVAAGQENPRLIGSFASPYHATDLSHLSEVRGLARQLQIDMMANIAQNDPPGTARAAKAVLAYSDALAEEPVLASQLTRLAILSHAATMTEQLINRIGLTDEMLASLQQRFSEYKDSLLPAVQRALAAEMLATAELPWTATESPKPLAEDTLDLAGFKGFDIAVYVYGTVRLLNLNLFDQTVPGNDRIFDTISSFRAIRAAILLHPGGFVDSVRRGVAYAETARTLIALERYRRDHGQFPDTLDALAPDYLDAVPADPFTESSSLRYLRYPDRVVVYSIERNRTDDGGEAIRGSETDDLSLTLYLPEYRPTSWP